MWLQAVVDVSLEPSHVYFLMLMGSCGCQVSSHRDGGRHWKVQRANDPSLIAYFFSNNFW